MILSIYPGDVFLILFSEKLPKRKGAMPKLRLFSLSIFLVLPLKFINDILASPLTTKKGRLL